MGKALNWLLDLPGHRGPVLGGLAFLIFVAVLMTPIYFFSLKPAYDHSDRVREYCVDHAWKPVSIRVKVFFCEREDGTLIQPNIK